MRIIFLVSCLLLPGCGYISRLYTHWTGDLSYKCAKTGIEYVQSDSGLAMLIDQNGSIVKCED